ncbi:MAG: hypothetical protein P8107_09815 [Spirochaetia bacterium]
MKKSKGSLDNNYRGIPVLITEILFGYMKSFFNLIRFGLILILLGGVSMGVIFPLWFVSTNFKGVFTFVSLCVLILLLCAFVIFKIYKIIKQHGIMELLFKIGKIMLVFVCLALIGMIIVLYSLYFAPEKPPVGFFLSESLFISVLIISILYIYMLSKLRTHELIAQGIYRIVMTITLLSLSYFVLLMLMQNRFLHFCFALVLYVTCFGYLLYGQKNAFKKQKHTSVA